MLYWYCKTTYNLRQFFSLKRHTIWDGGSDMIGLKEFFWFKNLSVTICVFNYKNEIMIKKKL